MCWHNVQIKVNHNLWHEMESNIYSFPDLFLVFCEEFFLVIFFPSRSANFFLSAIMLALHSRGQHAFFSFTADSIHILPAMLFHPHLHLLHPENIKDKKEIKCKPAKEIGMITQVCFLVLKVILSISPVERISHIHVWFTWKCMTTLQNANPNFS